MNPQSRADVQCENCNRYYQKRAYYNHYQSCIKLNKYKIILDDGRYKCKLCNHTYKTDNTINIHLKKCLNKNKGTFANYSINNGVQNAHTIETPNQQNNMPVVPFGKENIKLLSIQQINNILQSSNFILPQIIKEINFNVNLPQFQNMKMRSNDSQYIYIVKGEDGKYVKELISNVLKNIIIKNVNNANAILIDYMLSKENGTLTDNIVRLDDEQIQNLEYHLDLFDQNSNNEEIQAMIQKTIANYGEYHIPKTSYIPQQYNSDVPILQNYFNYLYSRELNLHCIDTFRDPNFAKNICKNVNFVHNVFEYYNAATFLEYIDKIPENRLLLCLIYQIFYNPNFIQNTIILCVKDNQDDIVNDQNLGNLSEFNFYLYLNVGGYQKYPYLMVLSILRDNIMKYVKDYLFTVNNVVNNALNERFVRKMLQCYQLVKHDEIQYSYWIRNTNNVLNVIPKKSLNVGERME